MYKGSSTFLNVCVLVLLVLVNHFFLTQYSIFKTARLSILLIYEFGLVYCVGVGE